MASHHVANEDQLSEEQMTFPYLLDLDDDVKLPTAETVEELTSEEESEEHPSEQMIAHTLPTIKLTRSNSAPNLTTDNLVFAATSATANVLSTNNESTEVARSTDETLNRMHNQLAEAQKEIIDLRHLVSQNQARLFENGMRMLDMENTLRKLVMLHPTLQDPNPWISNLTPTANQPGTSSKRKLKGNPDGNLPQPLIKKTKTVQTRAAGPQKETYKGSKPYCSNCNHHHEGSCKQPCKKCKFLGRQCKNCNISTPRVNTATPKVCLKCGNSGHKTKNCKKHNNHA